MDRRLELHALLLLLGAAKVYFQPPSGLQMVYPAIVYERDSMNTEFAGNKPYSITNRYAVTVIAREPDNDIPEKLAVLPMCTFSTQFTTEGLHHTVFNLYF